MLDSRVLGDQQLNERMQQRFASLSGVVNAKYTLGISMTTNGPWAHPM